MTSRLKFDGGGGGACIASASNNACAAATAAANKGRVNISANLAPVAAAAASNDDGAVRPEFASNVAF